MRVYDRRMNVSTERIREARRAAGMSQRVLAVAVGVSEDTIRRTEQGTHETGANVLGRIAQVLGVSVDDLYENATDPAPTAA